MKSDNTNYALLNMLANIEDYRKKRGVRYKLCDLLLLCIYSILSGFTCATDIEYYVEVKFNYFKELLNLKEVPSHDTFSKVLRLTNFDKLADILNEWLDSYYPEICKKYGKYKILHVDGKAVLASSEKSNGERPIYLLNAMYEGGTIRVYSKQVGEKENEISKLPSFLSTFNLEDTIVTIDAMGDNNTVISSIVENKGDYLTIVKENQGNLFNAIKDECEKLETSKVKNRTTGEVSTRFSRLKNYEITEKEHGRVETYKITLLKDLSFIYDKLGIVSFYGTIGKVGILDKTTQAKEKGEYKTTYTRNYIICSLEDITCKKMLEIKRNHWNIEMQHWILDVEYNEDRSTARKDNAISNASMFKRFAMRIKKQHKELNDLSLNRFFIYTSDKAENITKLLFGESNQ